MSDADNQIGGSGDRFSKEDQEDQAPRHGAKKETEKDDGQAAGTAGNPR